MADAVVKTGLIELKYPIKFKGEAISQLTMRRAKVRDTFAAQKVSGTDADQERWLFATLCEVEPDMIDELDMSDYLQLQKTYTGFLS